MADQIIHGVKLPCLGGPYDGAVRPVEQLMPEIFGKSAPIAVLIFDKRYLYEVDLQKHAYVFRGDLHANTTLKQT